MSARARGKSRVPDPPAANFDRHARGRPVGRSPGIHVFSRHQCRALPSLCHRAINRLMRGGWVYIMTNRPNGTLYTGVTSNIARRAWEHRTGAVDGFTKRHGLKHLVYAERHDDIASAIR